MYIYSKWRKIVHNGFCLMRFKIYLFDEINKFAGFKGQYPFI